MPDNSDPRRDALHEALQTIGPADMDRPAVLTGWVFVAEWMDDQGERFLSKGRAASTSHWCGDGMLHEALYGNWPSPDEE